MGFEDRPPSRMTLVNMVTGDSRIAQFNPETFTETIGVNYASMQVPGLSHTRKHFINTEDVKFEFELFFTCLDDVSPSSVAAIADMDLNRKFLYALTHPWRSDGIRRGGPPRVIFIWPTFITLNCVVRMLAFTYLNFNRYGTPTAFKAKVSLEEIRDVFVSMEDILSLGTQRADFGNVDPSTIRRQ